MNSNNFELESIDQSTIECDLRKFTDWLNRGKDQLNWLTNVYVELKETVDNLTIRMKNVEDRVTIIEGKVENLEERMIVVEGDITEIKQTIESLQQIVNTLVEKVDMLYRWLPVPYGTIEGRGWKFAMGNISVMSDNGGTASIDGAGIYTSGAIENNDLYFN